MAVRTGWTRQQLLVAFALYCELPFGKLHSRNSQIKLYAKLLGRTPSALAMKLTNIASLDPAITATGRRGLSGASAADESMWREMQEDWPRFAVQSREALKAVGVVDDVVSTGAQADTEAGDYEGLSKSALVSVRIGQAAFRKAVLSAYESRCCISGLAIPGLLVASHIVPWRADPRQRLNPRNGLCLSALHDRAFDLGLITLTDEFTVKVSGRLRVANDSFLTSSLLSFDRQPVRLPNKFRPGENFLDYHRQNIFLG